MEKKVYESYLEILREELVPALGCTEPIAIAYATATAASVLEKVIKTDDDGNKKYDGYLNLYCSGNIIKNVKSVTVPNSGGMRGIEAAAVLGMVVVRQNGNWKYWRELQKLNAFRRQNFWKHNSAHVILKKE